MLRERRRQATTQGRPSVPRRHRVAAPLDPAILDAGASHS